MGLVLAVRHPMVVEVRGGREALAAQRALVRLLAGVYPCVCVEGGGCAEPLAAHGAHVRPLTLTGTNRRRSEHYHNTRRLSPVPGQQYAVSPTSNET